MMRRYWLLGGAAVLVAALIGIRIAGNSGAKQGLDAALANLPPGYSATHGAVTYDALAGSAQLDHLVIRHDGAPLLSADAVSVSGLSGGGPDGVPERIGRLTLTGVSAPIYRHIARLEVDGLEVAHLWALADPARFAAVGRVKVLDRIDAFDLDGHFDGSDLPQSDSGSPKIQSLDVHAGHAMVGGLRIGPLSRPLDSGLLGDVRRRTELAFATAEDRAAAEDITLSVPGQITTAIKSDAVEGYDSGRLRRATIEGLSMNLIANDAKVSLGMAAASGMDLTGLRPAMEAAASGLKVPENADLRMDGFEMQNLVVDSPKVAKITLDKFRFGANGPAGGQRQYKAAMTGFSILTGGRPLPAAQRLVLDRFGMADFTADLEGSGAYDPKGGTEDIDHFDLSLHGLGDLRASASLTHVSANSGTGVEAEAALRAIEIVRARTVWEDHSLTTRLINLAAAQSGRSPDLVRASLALALAGAAALMPNQPDAADQVNRFLDGRHMLKVTLNPPSPVSIGTVQDATPDQKAVLLGAHVEGN